MDKNELNELVEVSLGDKFSDKSNESNKGQSLSSAISKGGLRGRTWNNGRHFILFSDDGGIEIGEWNEKDGGTVDINFTGEELEDLNEY